MLLSLVGMSLLLFQRTERFWCFEVLKVHDVSIN